MLSELLAPDKRKIILIILSFLVLPSFFVAAFVFSFVLKSASDQVGTHFAAEQKLLVSKYESEVNSYLKSIVQSLRFAAVARSTTGDSFDQIFNSLNQTYGGIFMSLSLYDAQGNPIERIGYIEGHEDVMPVANSAHEDGSNGLAISDVLAGRKSAPFFFIHVSFDYEGRAYVLRTTVNALAFSAMLDNVRFGRTGEIFIINGRGVLQTRSLSSGAILQVLDQFANADAKVEESGTVVAPDGADYYYTMARLESNRAWFLVAMRNAGEQKQILLAQTFKLILLFSLCLAVLLLVAHVAIRRLLHHYDALDSCQAQLQVQSMQNQKRMAVEQLSVGIAHEINNPLAVIGEEAGWMQDLLKRESMAAVPEHDEFKKSLGIIATQIGRCREITHKLLSFARKLNYVVRDVDLRVQASEVIGLRQAEVAEKNIVIDSNLAANLPIIHSEPILLRQALLAILDNAIDAISGEGRIVVTAQKDALGGVCIKISDTGRGIPTENIDKIFDPFFTTKEPGKGTGLGLSICWGIVQKLGGEITVETKPGEETTFTVKLPLDPPKDNS